MSHSKGAPVTLQEYEVYFGESWQMFVWATSEEDAMDKAVDAFSGGLQVQPTGNYETHWVEE